MCYRNLSFILTFQGKLLNYIFPQVLSPIQFLLVIPSYLPEIEAVLGKYKYFHDICAKKRNILKKILVHSKRYLSTLIILHIEPVHMDLGVK